MGTGTLPAYPIYRLPGVAAPHLGRYFMVNGIYMEIGNKSIIIILSYNFIKVFYIYKKRPSSRKIKYIKKILKTFFFLRSRGSSVSLLISYPPYLTSLSSFLLAALHNFVDATYPFVIEGRGFVMDCSS